MKIGVYTSLFFTDPNSETLVSKHPGPVIYNLLGYAKCTNAMFASARKYFLKNHEVECILLTNIDNPEEYGFDTTNVTVIKKDYRPKVKEHAFLMKVLSIDFIDTTKYDRLYCVDNDSIFINEVTDEDLLPYDMVAQRHWARESATFERVYINSTMCVNVDFDYKNQKYEWVMGNFFGGKANLMKEMVDQTLPIHNKLVDTEVHYEIQFYTRYSEELFVAKYMYENLQNYKLLDAIYDIEERPQEDIEKNTPEGKYSLPGWGVYPRSDRTKQYWLSEFKRDESLYPNIHNVKLLHGTKANLPLLDKVTKFYC